VAVDRHRSAGRRHDDGAVARDGEVLLGAGGRGSAEQADGGGGTELDVAPLEAAAQRCETVVALGEQRLQARRIAVRPFTQNSVSLAPVRSQASSSQAWPPSVLRTLTTSPAAISISTAPVPCT